MNILTKNRILQKGDEYRNNGEWKPVPKNNYGLQIQFTTYKEVRRPSETPQNLRETPVTAKDAPTEVAKSPVSPTPISPEKCDKPDTGLQKAESDESPASSHSGAGDASYLPTVVSKKAHKNSKAYKETVSMRFPPQDEQFGLPPEERPVDAPTYDPTGPAPFPKGPIEKAAEKVAAVGAAYNAKNGLVKITFPKPDPTNLIEMETQPIWTGRNGTFTGYGLEAMRVNNNVMFSPIGKRGVGNCAIQVPLASIDELIEWLKKQTPK